MTRDRAVFVTEWAATFTLFIGVYLTAINVYPLNVYVSLFANFLWLIVGVAWRKLSLIVVQLVVTALYVYGMWSHAASG